MDVELVAQMFKNYRSNVLFHLEGIQSAELFFLISLYRRFIIATDSLQEPS